MSPTLGHRLKEGLIEFIEAPFADGQFRRGLYGFDGAGAESAQDIADVRRAETFEQLSEFFMFPTNSNGLARSTARARLPFSPFGFRPPSPFPPEAKRGKGQ